MEDKYNNKSKTVWHDKDVSFAMEMTKASYGGLTNEEARARLDKYGKNTLPQKKSKPFFIMLFQELINPIVLILIVAMGFSFIVGEFLDGLVILGIILIDAIIGAVQSKRAERVASSLSNMIKVKARALRGGNKVEIDSSELVIGDIVFLESGDKISADMRIIECHNFTVDESLLTGESINANKDVDAVAANASLGDRKCMVFSGTSVITGRAKCVVVGAGVNTKIGRAHV